MKKHIERPRKYPNVYNLKCSITGKNVKTTPVAFNKMFKKSGVSRETFIKNYISQEGRRIKKNGNSSFMLQKAKNNLKLSAQQVKSYYNKLNYDQKARWFALLMAIDEIDQNCRNKKINFNTLEMSAIPIKHFINDKFCQIKNDIEIIKI